VLKHYIVILIKCAAFVGHSVTVES